MKEIAPSTELRKWFGHEPAKWDAFCRRYGEELRPNEELLGQPRGLARKGTVTLVYSAHKEAHNDAIGCVACCWDAERARPSRLSAIPDSHHVVAQQRLLILAFGHQLAKGVPRVNDS